MKASLFLCIVLVMAACSDNAVYVPKCHKGTVIGKIRSAGGGVAVSMENAMLSNHKWKGHKHVIEALNVPVEYRKPGQVIYFTARPGTVEEQGPYTADGDESDKPLIYVLSLGVEGCPGTPGK